MSKCYVFGYGSLRPSEEPPKTMSAYVEDSIAGHEIQFENRHKGKKKWAEVETEDKDEEIKGYTLLIDESELPELDKREAPDYKRKKVKTNNGFDAWTYDYTGDKK